MKKFFVSMGLAAAGTASLHALDLLGTENDKLWTVSATLRGFYDDNYLTSTKKLSSVGFELRPEFQMNIPLQQTEIGLRYNYALSYYFDREQRGVNPIDQFHQFDLWIDHAFNPRWDLTLSDTVSVAQEPNLSTAPTVVTRRVNGNNIANTANLTLHTDWTRKFSTDFTYGNSIYFYESRGANVTTNAGVIAVDGSYAGRLNRMEQSFNPEAQWHFSRTTVGLLGYRFGLVNFTGNEAVGYVTNAPAHFVKSSSRDNYSHSVYIGGTHQFLENLMGMAKAGMQYTEYYNDAASTSSLGPYANLSLVYTYTPGGYAQLGFLETRNETDAIDISSNGQITQDQLSSVLYASINHPLTPKLTANAIARYQHSTWHDSQLDGQSADLYDLGFNFTYSITRHFSSEIGYTFDYYTTPIAGESYTRNKIYLGLTASY
jgi:Putative beta-barrel porin 2